MDNSMCLRIKAIESNESFARSVVSAFCVGNNPSLETVNDIKTAISEAVTNSIVHGYTKYEGDILLEATIKDDLLTVRVIDYGIGILDVDTALGDYYTTEKNGERSGLGFTIMQSFMDSLEVESVMGAGTTVTMTKKLNV
ncbi:MAG: anti-sigma F factor [Clostridia bacterium]